MNQLAINNQLDENLSKLCGLLEVLHKSSTATSYEITDEELSSATWALRDLAHETKGLYDQLHSVPKQAQEAVTDGL